MQMRQTEGTKERRKTKYSIHSIKRQVAYSGNSADL